MAHQSKTQIYLKVKKPLLERQRRARINNCLDALKKVVAELQADDAILRMDKAEVLEQTLSYVRKQSVGTRHGQAHLSEHVYADYFRHGYMNAVNEVSRVMASTPGMNVEIGKSVMIHLGRTYNRLQQQQQAQEQKQHQQQLTAQQQQQQVLHRQSQYELHIECSPPLSPASSGYHSDCESPAASPAAHKKSSTADNLWRPW
ncbi:enhancer of split m8 protein-like [Eurosta solidaginis]|uniref:enhancer of split m8 protein-like n=1 Tax=Eurosta solidaginis TaxID=178769 RepID=UPI003530C192